MVDGGKGTWCTGGGLMDGGIMYVGVVWTGLACIFGSYYGLGVEICVLTCEGGNEYGVYIYKYIAMYMDRIVCYV